jgi:hypothetical protein
MVNIKCAAILRKSGAILEDIMGLPASGWKNKGGTASRPVCKCGSWKNHWTNYSGQKWPNICSVDGCQEEAEVGAHIRNPDVEGEYIAPFCSSCNTAGTDTNFTLRTGINLVSANRSETCECKKEDCHEDSEKQTRTKVIIEAVKRRF